MKRKLLTCALFLACASGAFAQCGSYTVVNGKCARNLMFGWGTAGFGTQSVITQWVRAAAANNVQLVFNRIGTVAGTGYTGYLALDVSVNGGAPQLFVNGQSPTVTVIPHSGTQILVTKLCFDPTCTAAPPANVTVANMFSASITLLGSSASDLNAAPLPDLTVQFLQNSQITFQEQEQAVDLANTQLAGLGVYAVNEGATPASRYVYNGAAVTAPFTVFSVTNPSASQTLSWYVQLFDESGNAVATSANFSTPPLGASGYLLIGQTPSDPLGLFPSSTVLPAGADGIFHGFYLVASNPVGLPIIYLSQVFWGNSMLNATFLQ